MTLASPIIVSLLFFAPIFGWTPAGSILQVPQDVDVESRVQADPNNCNVYYYLKVPMTCGRGNGFNKKSLRCDTMENIVKVHPECQDQLASDSDDAVLGDAGSGGGGRGGGADARDKSGDRTRANIGGGEGRLSQLQESASSRQNVYADGGSGSSDSGSGLQTGDWEVLRKSRGWKIFPTLYKSSSINE